MWYWVQVLSVEDCKGMAVGSLHRFSMLTCLRDLNAGGCMLPEEGTWELLRALPAGMTCLDLSTNAVSVPVARLLGGWLALRRLVLEHQISDEEGGYELARQLGKLNRLKELGLRIVMTCSVSTKDAVAVEEALRDAIDMLPGVNAAVSIVCLSALFCE